MPKRQWLLSRWFALSTPSSLICSSTPSFLLICRAQMIHLTHRCLLPIGDSSSLIYNPCYNASSHQYFLPIAITTAACSTLLSKTYTIEDVGYISLCVILPRTISPLQSLTAFDLFQITLQWLHPSNQICSTLSNLIRSEGKQQRPLHQIWFVWSLPDLIYFRSAPSHPSDLIRFKSDWIWSESDISLCLICLIYYISLPSNINSIPPTTYLSSICLLS